MQLFEYIDVLNTPYHIYLETVSDTPLFVKPHWHYYAEMLYLTRGSAIVECKNITYTLTPGSLLFIADQSIHRIQVSSDLPTNYIVMKFDINTLIIPHAYISHFRAIFSQLKETGSYLFSPESVEPFPIRSLAEGCLKELESGEFAYDFNVQSNLSMILVYLARILAKEEKASLKTVKKEGSTFFSHILEYIDNHSHEPLQVQDLAQKSGMSYSNFAKVFKTQYGRSCKAYIEYIRICKAEEMVLYSSFDLSYIAQETGFADCSHLIRTYKKLKGITPKQARLNSAEAQCRR